LPYASIPELPTVGGEHRKDTDGSRATPRWWRIEPTHARDCPRRGDHRRARGGGSDGAAARRRWGQLMLASTALAARRTLLALSAGTDAAGRRVGIDPGPELRDLRPPSSHKILQLDMCSTHIRVMRAVTFLLTGH